MHYTKMHRLSCHLRNSNFSMVQVEVAKLLPVYGPRLAWLYSIFMETMALNMKQSPSYRGPSTCCVVMLSSAQRPESA